MIEKFNNDKNGNTEPMHKVIELAKERKMIKTDGIIVAEVGVGLGATAIELVKSLGAADTYFFFDYEHIVRELYDDLSKINDNKVNIIGIGNDKDKKYDSYTWNIAKLLLDWRRTFGTYQRLDITYLDGSHTFLFDAGTACLLKEMCSEGGYIILDDLNWRIADSPTCNPNVNPKILDDYTQEQIDSYQVKMIEQCFFDNDRRFRKIGNYNRIAIFQKSM